MVNGKRLRALVASHDRAQRRRGTARRQLPLLPDPLEPPPPLLPPPPDCVADTSPPDPLVASGSEPGDWGAGNAVVNSVLADPPSPPP
jgi:hypothetical protein